MAADREEPGVRRGKVTLYPDNSALAKLVLSDVESTHLREWLRHRPTSPLVTNSIGVVEFRRLAARISQEALSTAVLLLACCWRASVTSS